MSMGHWLPMENSRSSRESRRFSDSASAANLNRSKARLRKASLSLGFSLVFLTSANQHSYVSLAGKYPAACFIIGLIACNSRQKDGLPWLDFFALRPYRYHLELALFLCVG